MGKQHFILIDILLVTLFALIGRASHDKALSPAGVLQTASPFLVALVIGWAVLLLRKRPVETLSTGVFLWLVTVAGGMMLRRATEEGTAVAFVIVASITLALFLIGWRLLRAVVVRRRGEVADAPH